MSNNSEKSNEVTNKFFNISSLPKLAGSVIVIGLSISAGLYVYNKYYKNVDNLNNKESDEI